jgi:hypothetical protein
VVVENFQFVGAGGSRAGGGGASGEESAPRRSGGRSPQANQGEAQAGGDVDYGDIPF